MKTKRIKPREPEWRMYYDEEIESKEENPSFILHILEGFS